MTSQALRFLKFIERVPSNVVEESIEEELVEMGLRVDVGKSQEVLSLLSSARCPIAIEVWTKPSGNEPFGQVWTCLPRDRLTDAWIIRGKRVVELAASHPEDFLLALSLPH